MRPPKAPLGVNVSRSTGQQTISVLKVYLNNGEFRSVKCGDATDVKGIIHLLCGQLHPSPLPLEALFALRLRHAATGDLQWLHRDTTLHQVLDKYLPRQSLNDWRFELRVRYLLANLDDFLQRDRVTFTFFYEQVKNDYLKMQDEVEVELAITLCCLEIRRFYKDVSQLSIDKKSTALEFLEREVGLDRFLPACVLLQHKAKALRKMILAQFKNVVRLSETQCMLQFLRSVKRKVAFDREVFLCQLGTGWTVSVELVISCELGIGFATDARGPLRPVGQFAQVQNIETIVHEGDSRALVRLRVAGTAEPLSVSCENLRVAEAIADLVDGYCRLVHSTNASYWTRKELKAGESEKSEISRADNDSESESTTDDNHPPRYRRSSSKPRSAGHAGVEILGVGESKLRHSEDYAEIVDDVEGDYSSATRDLELDRATLTLGEVIGQGQFGAVHRGEWRAKDGTRVQVAIKTCNGQGIAKREIQEQYTTGDELTEDDGADKLLDEAHTMKQLDHPHIIRLVGTCSSAPVWIVMELARLGELRAFLQRHRDRITLPRQLLWSRQLASALCYIQQKGLVHRDVAARNVLVASRDCVKLADFGLSRELGHAAEYTASRGKLPIKWMAPESINFRRFTSASDVWMFAVCVWEILSLGIKPFQGVKNGEVVARLEDGERLPLPHGCPPRLYSVLSLCWSYDPAKRPTFLFLKEALLEIYNEERAQAESCRRELRRTNALSWGSDGSDGSDEPPPKPARPASEHRNSVCGTPTPPTTATASQASSGSATVAPLAPATYIVAETPEVLARLMRDNDGSMPPAWAYVAPASPTNTFAVGGHNMTSFEGDRVISPTGATTPEISPPLGALGVAAGGVAAALEAAARDAGLVASTSGATNESSLSVSCSPSNVALLLPAGGSNAFNTHLQQDNPPPPPAPKSPPLRSKPLGVSSGLGSTLVDERDLLEKRLLEIKIKDQQREAERDQRWLNEQPLPFGTPPPQASVTGPTLGQTSLSSHARARQYHLGTSTNNNSSANGMPKSPASSHSISVGSATPSTSAVITPRVGSSTANRYGEGEPIYEATTGVVRAVMRLSEGVRAHQAEAYVELVRQTGLALRGLLAAVDGLSPTVLGVDPRTRRVEPAQRVLSADMAALVSAVKLAVQRPTDSEQRRAMLEAAHSLAVDAKNLLDIVDLLRTTEVTGAHETPAATSSSSMMSVSSSVTKSGIVTSFGRHSRSGSQSECGSSISGERILQSECSTPRSSTPTSFKSESLPRSTSASHHSESQTGGQSLRSGASTPGLGLALSQGTSHAESVGSLPCLGRSTPSNTFSSFQSCASGSNLGGSLPRSGGLVAGLVEAINSGCSSRASPLTSPHSQNSSNSVSLNGSIGIAPPAFVIPASIDGSLLNVKGVGPMRKQNSTSSLGTVLDSASAGGHTSVKMMASDGPQHHHQSSSLRKMSTSSIDEQISLHATRPHASTVSIPRKPPPGHKPPLPSTTASGIYDNP
ncbi:focal adhesion kinase 1-like isoform X3 [Varroa destructor]|nr:focal adhesion kinase 1-like isoform X3 [Varroa destructor]XP_022661650.1 focal adhesion kinase 1-like isoform X3 [Varroa destructor]XP_022661651.1 focal adhesion kinase 1-like isoform X3 [Varroa destructor]XP_022661652.1 focal adhesion kinase 1-like isoform X3 [Varroa destructor]XP_022661653.1 focal adhesion kinase 1-like isoform X3 [Varroa destructor]XP_022661654.1 focal adhesion kinase 1-like isoform X3 [Varroa destructor]XP_022661656.1 focal adhesion kinase 1-like isoform X3 [Varroa de